MNESVDDVVFLICMYLDCNGLSKMHLVSKRFRCVFDNKNFWKHYFVYNDIKNYEDSWSLKDFVIYVNLKYIMDYVEGLGEYDIMVDDDFDYELLYCDDNDINECIERSFMDGLYFLKVFKMDKYFIEFMNGSENVARLIYFTHEQIQRFLFVIVKNRLKNFLIMNDWKEEFLALTQTIIFYKELIYTIGVRFQIPRDFDYTLLCLNNDRVYNNLKNIFDKNYTNISIELERPAVKIRYCYDGNYTDQSVDKYFFTKFLNNILKYEVHYRIY